MSASEADVLATATSINRFCASGGTKKPFLVGAYCLVEGSSAGLT